MTRQRLQNCLPIKSNVTGDTLALVSMDGILLRNKRNRQWELFSIEAVLKMQTEVAEMIAKQEEAEKEQV
jgi:hypothetical protein